MDEKQNGTWARQKLAALIAKLCTLIERGVAL